MVRAVSHQLGPGPGRVGGLGSTFADLAAARSTRYMVGY